MLIATDLDGTLVGPDGMISARTREAVRAAEEAGVPVVPVTARQIYGLDAWRGDLGRWALCSNGAICWDLHSSTVLFRRLMPSDLVAEFGRRLVDVAPGTRFVAIRDDGMTFAAEEGYAELASHSDHNLDPAQMSRLSRDEVWGADCLKLVARHPTMPVTELADLARGLDMPQVHVTTSGAPMLEVSPAGVTKDAGLQMLCDHLGVPHEETVAFGDGPNDVEMLTWAARSWAVANAVPAARDAADHLAPSNAEDGVARVIEELLAAR